jgi:hypothetical protein
MASVLQYLSSEREGKEEIMNLAPRQRKKSGRQIQQPDFDMQSLRQGLCLLEKSLERYEYLKNSGAPEIILYTEKGLIGRQLQFLSRVSEGLQR